MYGHTYWHVELLGRVEVWRRLLDRGGVSRVDELGGRLATCRAVCRRGHGHVVVEWLRGARADLAILGDEARLLQHLW